MRISLGRFPYPVIGAANHTATIPSFISSAYSTSSGGSGGGRGRGGFSPFPFTTDNIGNSKPETSNDESLVNPSQQGQGHGRGRGRPVPSSPILPSFTSFVNNDAPHGRGRGYGPVITSPGLPVSQESEQAPHPSARKPTDRKSFSFVDADAHDDETSSLHTMPRNQPERSLPSEIVDVLSGAGRGKPISRPSAVPAEKPKAPNRHLRPSQQPQPRTVNAEAGAGGKSSSRDKLSTEEKVKLAVGILSRPEDAGVARGRGGFRGRPGGRGGRGRGRVGGRGRRGQDRYDDSDDEPGGLYLGDPADGEKLAQKLGPDIMNKLVEGFEEMSSRVLPSPVDDAYVDALHTNLMIECESEYLMGDFETNPDIDENPPIPLRDALQKVKPFIMAYEGIQSQEEWEEAIEETMKNVPLMEKIVDYYGGPLRITAKQQQQELERVAKTIPENTHDSVKNYVNRAVLSLQSNPGWGFDKKCQFMDKLVREVSQPSR